MPVCKNYSVSVTVINGASPLGSVECYADDVNPWVFVGIEDENANHYISLPLTIEEINDLIEALKLSIEDAKMNRP